MKNIKNALRGFMEHNGVKEFALFWLDPEEGTLETSRKSQVAFMGLVILETLRQSYNFMESLTKDTFRK